MLENKVKAVWQSVETPTKGMPVVCDTVDG